MWFYRIWVFVILSDSSHQLDATISQNSQSLGICLRIAIYCGPMPVIRHRYPLPEVFHSFIGLPNSSKPRIMDLHLSTSG